VRRRGDVAAGEIVADGSAHVGGVAALEMAGVATNATLSKTDANRLALMADDGFAKAIVPSHTVGDGDTVFALATGHWSGDVSLTVLGALAAEAMAEAIVRAVSMAESLPGVPAARDLGTVPPRLK
jgi:L-aminopeptidase/D-esterase-like protein